MNHLFNPWSYGSKDSLSTVWYSVMNALFIGATEGVIIYALIQTSGVFDNIPIYG